MEQILLETVPRYMKNKEVIDDSQHSFTKCKLCLPNLVTFYDRLTVVEERATDMGLCKAFDAVLLGILVSTLERHGFARWNIHWIKILLDGHAHRFSVNHFVSK